MGGKITTRGRWEEVEEEKRGEEEGRRGVIKKEGGGVAMRQMHVLRDGHST